MQKDYWDAVSVCRNLIEGVGMIDVCRRAFAREVEPVLRRVILTLDGFGHTAAGGKNTLLGNNEMVRLSLLGTSGENYHSDSKRKNLFHDL